VVSQKVFRGLLANPEISWKKDAKRVLVSFICNLYNFLILNAAFCIICFNTVALISYWPAQLIIDSGY